MPAVVFYEYIAWQYGNGIREYFRAWQNIHWFLWRVFSISLLVRTFFTPFRRTSESYGVGFDPAAWGQTLIINLVTRIVGALVRTVLITVALIFHAGIVVLGGVGFILFIMTPIIVPLSVLVAIIVILT